MHVIPNTMQVITLNAAAVRSMQDFRYDVTTRPWKLHLKEGLHLQATRTNCQFCVLKHSKFVHAKSDLFGTLGTISHSCENLRCALKRLE